MRSSPSASAIACFLFETGLNRHASRVGFSDWPVTAVAAVTPYPITEYQPLLWEVDSIRQAFEMMRDHLAPTGVDRS